MKKRVTVLCGVSGSGKTYKRTHDPDLCRLPCVDIADIYREYPEFDWFVATSVVCLRVCWLLLRNNHHVVVEGYFLPGTASRTMLAKEMQVAGADAEFILLTVTTATARQRILDQYDKGEVTWANADYRIKLLLRVQPYPVPNMGERDPLCQGGGG